MHHLSRQNRSRPISIQLHVYAPITTFRSNVSRAEARNSLIGAVSSSYERFPSMGYSSNLTPRGNSPPSGNWSSRHWAFTTTEVVTSRPELKVGTGNQTCLRWSKIIYWVHMEYSYVILNIKNTFRSTITNRGHSLQLPNHSKLQSRSSIAAMDDPHKARYW